MTAIPVITAFGGANPAGRSSFHHGYRRMIFDALGTAEQAQTLAALAGMTGVDAGDRERLLKHSLIREIEAGWFDTDKVPMNRSLKLQGDEDAPTTVVTRRRDLPETLPAGWKVEELDANRVRLTLPGSGEILIPDSRGCEVRSGGLLPTGFNPGALYQERAHPRGVQLAIYAASDMLGQLGIEWSTITGKVSPDDIAVYAGSAMSQLDEQGNLGLLASRYRGKRPSSKQLAFGLSDMAGDFVNAYVLGNVGSCGHTLGACATFLYNLRSGVNDIREGRARIAIVGASEAGLTPEVIEGYSTMGALATVDGLMKLACNAGRSEPDYRNASRPFGDNCGFTLGEGAQFVMLMDDSLALELGADIHGAVTDVFVNADGFKKSISSPGVGNILTVAKATAAARDILGDKRLRERSFVQAHGTGTPQNRTTESNILSTVAGAFGIESWPVVAQKAFVGHTVASASGDQLVGSLGIFERGILPGITTIDAIADDVQQKNLEFSLQHREREPGAMDAAILNAKGFGGNNASAVTLSAGVALAMLRSRHGKSAMRKWEGLREQTREAAAHYDESCCDRIPASRYLFDHEVLAAEQVQVSDSELRIEGWENPVALPTDGPFSGLLPEE